MSARALTEHSNDVKEIFLENMLLEGCITQEQFDNMKNYCIVVAEKGYFGRIWDKIFWKNDDDMNIATVKIIK